MIVGLLSMFGQGLLHGLGPDHCLAIGALSAGGRGGLREAATVSLRFGVGHTLVLAAGALAAAVTGVMIPARWESTLEVVGGLSLLALGVWTVLSRRGQVAHTHLDGTVHAHADGDARSHAHTDSHGSVDGRAQTLAGALFGLSGVRGLVLLLPLMARDRAWALALGVVLFGAGVVASMFAVGWFTQRATVAARRWERGLRVPVGVASMVCGAWWVVSHV